MLKENKANLLIDNAINNLIKSIESGQSEELQNYFQAMAKFHAYSFYNTLLIFKQCEYATHVAGFITWKKLGRYVKKGEKGIAIISPRVYKKDEPDDTEYTHEIKGFKAVYVFDISQTEGEELPELNKVKGDPTIYSENLNLLISSQNIKLEYSDKLVADGCSTGGKIVIKSELSPPEDFSVRVHELAHELLHHNKEEKLSKRQKETEAEAVAYIVSQAIGLDTNVAFADYIQLYKGDKDTLLKSFERIQKVSGGILQGIEINN